MSQPPPRAWNKAHATVRTKAATGFHIDFIELRLYFRATQIGIVNYLVVTAAAVLTLVLTGVLLRGAR